MGSLRYNKVLKKWKDKLSDTTCGLVGIFNSGGNFRIQTHLLHRGTEYLFRNRCTWQLNDNAINRGPKLTKDSSPTMICYMNEDNHNYTLLLIVHL